jgi:UDP-2,3-diacylglucosamine pyrophosphatase LpxH
MDQPLLSLNDGNLPLNCTWTDARSVFLSDLHLGWRFSDTSLLGSLLEQARPEFLYLVGDTFEWIYRPEVSKKKSVDRFVDDLNSLQDHGTRIFILPGNHDEVLADRFHNSGWTIAPYVLHETLSGQRFLVAHGDVFDLQRGRNSCSWKRFGGWMYPKLVRWGTWLDRIGFQPQGEQSHWCTHWKMLSERAKNHIANFESFMVELALAHECDGVVCGHIHLPTEKEIGSQFYFNCGDWIEHRSFVYECSHGYLNLVRDASKQPHKQQSNCLSNSLVTNDWRVAV